MTDLKTLNGQQRIGHARWAVGLILPSLAGCVQIATPDEPIEINLNVNIEQHVKVEIDKDVKQAIKKNKDIF